MILDIFFVAASIALLAFGAHYVVEAASRIGVRLGMSELVIGLTFVAIGTSAPEFGVTVTAALEGRGDISMGNVVGSNIFNLGFILGGCALIRPIPTGRSLLMRDGAILAVASLVLVAFVYFDLELSALEGGLFLLALFAWLLMLYRTKGGGEDGPIDDFELRPSESIPFDVLLFGVGLASIVGGSELLVTSAVSLATDFGVSEWVVAVTIVAAGTSAPELAVSIASVAKHRYAIGAGGLVGSDIFNVLGVLGVAGTIHPVTIAAESRPSLVALPLMVLALLLFVRTGWKVSRFEGLLLVLFASARWWLDLSGSG